MKRLKVIACEIVFRELCLCASQTSNIVDFTFLSKGLHDIGCESMICELQKEIDKVDTEKYEAILLAYGLCSNGVIGLKSQLPMVIPKAHDCITFFLGSKEKYQDFFYTNTGAYIYTAGGIERELDPASIEKGITTQLGMNKTYEEYVEEYGEENAEYIMEILGGYETAYDKIVFINTKVGDVEKYRERLYHKAEKTGWTPSEMEGDNSLLLKFLDGDWNENDFTIIPPNHKIIATNDKNIIGYQALKS